MENYTKRILLFLFGCILIRTLFVFIAKYINPEYLPYLGALALLPAIGFLLIYINGWRKTGSEVFGGKIWWNNLRPIHALFYILFSILAFNKNIYSWVPLALDVIIGFLAFLYQHLYIN